MTTSQKIIRPDVLPGNTFSQHLRITDNPHERFNFCPPDFDDEARLLWWIETEYPNTTLPIAVYLASIAWPELKGAFQASRWEEWAWVQEFGDPTDPAYKIFWQAGDIEVEKIGLGNFVAALAEVQRRAPRLWRKLLAKHGAILDALHREWDVHNRSDA